MKVVYVPIYLSILISVGYCADPSPEEKAPIPKVTQALPRKKPKEPSFKPGTILRITTRGTQKTIEVIPPAE